MELSHLRLVLSLRVVTAKICPEESEKALRPVLEAKTKLRPNAVASTTEPRQWALGVFAPEVKPAKAASSNAEFCGAKTVKVRLVSDKKDTWAGLKLAFKLLRRASEAIMS